VERLEAGQLPLARASVQSRSPGHEPKLPDRDRWSHALYAQGAHRGEAQTRQCRARAQSARTACDVR